MINFTNENIQRELKKKKKNVLISLGFTIVFIILIVFFSILEENEQEVNLTEKTSSGTKASLEVFTSPINFAYYENEDSAFYMVYATKDRERNLLAIIKMKESDYESFKDVSLENPKTIHGITASVPNDIKRSGFSCYNYYRWFLSRIFRLHRRKSIFNGNHDDFKCYLLSYCFNLFIFDNICKKQIS